MASAPFEGELREACRLTMLILVLRQRFRDNFATRGYTYVDDFLRDAEFRSLAEFEKAVTGLCDTTELHSLYTKEMTRKAYGIAKSSELYLRSK